MILVATVICALMGLVGYGIGYECGKTEGFDKGYITAKGEIMR